MATIRTSTQTIYSDRAVTASWSWPSIGAYQHIQVNSAAWHWTAQFYAVPYYDVYHERMIPTNGGNGHNKEGVTTADLGITASTTSITAYFDLRQSEPGSADVWFVIDYDIINDIPPSTPSASDVTSGQYHQVSISNSAGLGSIKHRVTWSIGNYSYAADVGANVSTAGIYIPTEWQQAFTGASGAMRIKLETFLVSNNQLVGSKTINVNLIRDVNYDVPASAVSVSSVTAGRACVVSFTNTHLGTAKHQVTWAIGNNSYTVTTAVGDASASYVIPTSWCENFPNANSGVLTVTVQTLNTYDQARGSAVVREVTLYVPSYTPTVTGTATGVNQSWNLYLQNRSRVTISISAQGMYGSTITSYAITGHNLNVSAQSGTSEVLTQTGQVTYTCTVTDSRGKIGTGTVTITVIPYAPPMITQAEAYRCGPADLDPLPTGGRAAYVFNYNYASVENNNTITARIQLKLESTVITTITSPTTGQPALLHADLNTRRSYTAIYTVTDALGNSDTFEVLIPTAEVYMYFSRTLNSIGIGVYPEHPNSLELGNGFHLYLNTIEITPS
ncbi:MAG: hypothetical protein IJ210_15260 [Clostridia bacterium]|nr:hypothetical protein [Clostridia bacterium]